MTSPVNLEGNLTLIALTPEEIMEAIEKNASRILQLYSEFRDDLWQHKRTINVVLILLYLIVFIAGVVGNVAALAAFACNRRLRSQNSFFLVNLLVSDLLVIILCVPPTLAQIIYKEWLLGNVMCKLSSYVQGVAVAASIMTITALSVQRFVAVRSPLVSHGGLLRLRKTHRRLLPPAIWLLSLVTMVPLAIVRQMHVEQPILPMFGMEPIYFCTERWHSSRLRIGYSVFLLCFIYLLPAILLLTLYLGITRRLAASEANIVDQSVDASQANENIVLARRRAGHQCVLFAAFFVVCWLPYHVISALIDASQSTQMTAANQFLGDPFNVALLLAHANSAINPLLYCFAGKRFRGGAMKSFHLQQIGGRLQHCSTPNIQRNRLGS